MKGEQQYLLYVYVCGVGEKLQDSYSAFLNTTNTTGKYLVYLHIKHYSQEGTMSSVIIFQEKLKDIDR